MHPDPLDPGLHQTHVAGQPRGTDRSHLCFESCHVIAGIFHLAAECHTPELRGRRTRKRVRPDQEDGLLEKRLYSERPPREEYVLTGTGHDYLPVFLDAETGKDIKPVAIDAVTGAELGTRAIRVRTPE